jgi:hypothetical protein
MAEMDQPLRSSTGEEVDSPAGSLALTVTLDVPSGGFRFEWSQANDFNAIVARGRLVPASVLFHFRILDWIMEDQGSARWDGCSAWPASTNALLKRIRKLHPVNEDAVRIGLVTDSNLGIAQAGRWLPMSLPPGTDPWRWLSGRILQFARLVEYNSDPARNAGEYGRMNMHLLASALLEVSPSLPGIPEVRGTTRLLLDLHVTFDQVRDLAEFTWTQPGSEAAVGTGWIRCTGADQLTWELEREGRREATVSSHRRISIRAAINRWLQNFPTNRETVAGFWIQPGSARNKPVRVQEPPFRPDESPYAWIEDNLVAMAEALRFGFSPLGHLVNEMDPLGQVGFESYRRKQERREQKRADEETRRQEVLARMAEKRRRREELQAEKRKTLEGATSARAKAGRKGQTAHSKSGAPAPSQPLPAVPVHFDMPALAFQETAFPLADLRNYSLRERAALWWVSNQSDDLLCLPNCRIERLEHQLRTALRVLGPLRGRALLSDEVGLGKTIEAGIVMKELLTRGMVKKFLVLTVPSLVDQWQEELNDKFGLVTVTTNQSELRDNAERFWLENGGIVASLHTLKQPAHLEWARQVSWDILVVDEAHYLRNRESQAWQAVNVLPRQFLLLLTATPVQNSLEDLYNMVTLLRPGQLPTPKEFRSRFCDPKQPRRPREPEELRRLLSQVMIRNTRANSGLHLPPRHAETVLFQPDEADRAFWQQWDAEFRASLGELNQTQASLWGRLVLQTVGSSPAAWRTVLEKFPNRTAAQGWRERAPLEASWQHKCNLIPPLTRIEGGAVIFTQFLETQSSLEQRLRAAGVATFAINGATPAADRQPITEEFRKCGGALLLTHSGTEGRNLQFCHQLVNFDLPWNPMEIEQRIGRLHRLGQRHPVRIYNFVQAGTLQEHLLHILQEKLNLFELVVGETGLILGEQFGSDEFAEEILRRWRESEGQVAEAMAGLGDELASARDHYAEVKQLDETLFAKDYESL